ncbi:unnamed protein product [Arabidopsis halleri]
MFIALLVCLGSLRRLHVLWEALRVSLRFSGQFLCFGFCSFLGELFPLVFVFFCITLFNHRIWRFATCQLRFPFFGFGFPFLGFSFRRFLLFLPALAFYQGSIML